MSGFATGLAGGASANTSSSSSSGPATGGALGLNIQGITTGNASNGSQSTPSSTAVNAIPTWVYFAVIAMLGLVTWKVVTR